MSEDRASWLLEQIAEDEQLAKATIERTTYSRRMINGQMTRVKNVPPGWLRSPWPAERVLAECDAKRKMVEWAADRLADAARLESKGANKIDLMALRMGPECILDALLPIYADRPGYREEWKP